MQALTLIFGSGITWTIFLWVWWNFSGLINPLVLSDHSRDTTECDHSSLYFTCFLRAPGGICLSFSPVADDRWRKVGRGIVIRFDNSGISFLSNRWALPPAVWPTFRSEDFRRPQCVTFVDLSRAHCGCWDPQHHPSSFSSGRNVPPTGFCIKPSYCSTYWLTGRLLWKEGGLHLGCRSS